jgi:hypothetical protein
LASWDDWYLNNRSNIRIGVFNTGDISGADVSALQITSSIMTLTLSKVTQVANYTNSAGSLRSREPEWGTYYSYEPISTSQTLWSPQEGSWVSTLVSADQTPTFVAGETSYPGYFLSHTNINNYTYLPRSVGIAPAVGYAMEHPYALTSSYTSDIPNSYTIVPFVQDGGSWHVGSFFGACFTRTPCIPAPDKAGSAAPYYGPAGPFAWTRNVSTIELAMGAESVYKPYYWNAKIALDLLHQNYDPATDLTAFGGFAGISNELQDTRLFFYQNKVMFDDFSDILTLTPDGFYAYGWGIEQNSRYRFQDDQSGYNFLSYLHEIPVRSTSATVADYAIHVRGYVPTVRMQTGVRLIGKNFTDFGTATLTEIGDEIADLNGYYPIPDYEAYEWFRDGNLSSYSTVVNYNDSIRLGNGKFYSHAYSDAVVRFDGEFYQDSITFGKKLGYSGKTFTLNGYADTMTQYVNYYSTLRGSQAIYTEVLSTSTGRLNNYVVERYGTVLPSNIINRNRITDPLPFSALFSTYTVSPFAQRYDEWGLGWNLGFPKLDTPYLINLVSSTFIRILEDYIYLRLNPEMNLNTMGVSTKEDLSLTRDTFAEERKYFAKILLNNFGGFCRAAVQMPKDFNPYLGKYELLSLQLVDRNGVQISNVDCEYDIVMQITEVVDGAVNSYTVPMGY